MVVQQASSVVIEIELGSLHQDVVKGVTEKPILQLGPFQTAETVGQTRDLGALCHPERRMGHQELRDSLQGGEGRASSPEKNVGDICR